MEPRISLITLGVRDLERSFRFYRDGLGFPTTRKPEDGVVFFQNGGTRLALYPFGSLAEDVSPSHKSEAERSGVPRFPGITLAYNARTREEVDQVLAQALSAGARLEKAAHDTFWGGYSGYFSDPDGYLWEVAFGAFEISPEGDLIVT